MSRFDSYHPLLCYSHTESTLDSFLYQSQVIESTIIHQLECLGSRIASGRTGPLSVVRSLAFPLHLNAYSESIYISCISVHFSIYPTWQWQSPRPWLTDDVKMVVPGEANFAALSKDLTWQLSLLELTHPLIHQTPLQGTMTCLCRRTPVGPITQPWKRLMNITVLHQQVSGWLQWATRLSIMWCTCIMMYLYLLVMTNWSLTTQYIHIPTRLVSLYILYSILQGSSLKNLSSYGRRLAVHWTKTSTSVALLILFIPGERYLGNKMWNAVSQLYSSKRRWWPTPTGAAEGQVYCR